MGTRLEFRILGPLEVRRGGAPVGVGGPRQRALLALLLCNANRVLSRDQLIDELLADQPTRSLERILRVQISRLRKALADGEAEPRLIARPPGYVLRVEAGELDLEQFEDLSREGRAALEHGDSARAAALLCEAEGLWRGRPLADLEFEPFARFEVQRLEELRLLAIEDRIDAELALGRQGDLCAELTTLASEYPLRERLRGQLMLSLYRSGRQADALAVYRQTSEMLRDELGLDPSRTLRALERSILEQDTSLDGSPRVAVATRDESPAVCPFKGLDFFDLSDADYFFGRERLVAELLGRAAGSTLVGILGPSGIGKSSLLRAGVLAALARGELAGSDRWRQVVLRPGERPQSQLTRALGAESMDVVLEGLAPGERLVIAVDQLEELFTSCEGEDERAAFLEQLCLAASDAQQRGLVLVALRADFYTHLALYPRFADLLSCEHVLVGPMDRAELAAAIQQPAGRAGLEIERTLVDDLVSDAAGQSGGLPLLSAMLVELWQRRDGRVLRYESYRASGGMQAAVARLAEAAYVGLEAPQRRVARAVMLRLVSEQDGATVRRRAPVAELERIGGANPVVAALISARLLTLSDGRIELSHEAVLHEWPRYRGWLEEDQAGRQLHSHLTTAAGEWEAQARDPAELYRGARLAAALDWTAHVVDRLNSLEREFLDQSRLETERETRRQRAQNRRLRGLLAGVGVLFVLAATAGIVALLQRQSARNEARAAGKAARVRLAGQLGAEAVGEPRLDLAMLLAREAVNLDRSPQTAGSLLATLQRNPTVIGAFALPVDLASQVVVSPDGRTLAVSHFLINRVGFVDVGSLGDIRLYDRRTHVLERPPILHFGGVRAPVYSPDGSLLVYPTDGLESSTGQGAGPPSIAVLDMRALALRELNFDPAQGGRLTLDLGHATMLIAPDRRTVYCVYEAFDLSREFTTLPPGPTYLARWSLPNGRLLSTDEIDSGPVLATGLNSAGTRLAVVDARTVTVFDSGSRRRLTSHAITPAPAAATTAAISPAGAEVAIGSQAGRVSFVDASTGRARKAVSSAGGPVRSLTFSRDGRTVASTGNDNRVILWRPDTATADEVLTAPAEQVQYVAFSPDGRTLYTSSLGGVLLAWDLGGERGFGRRFALGSAVPCCAGPDPLAPPIALSPDGRTFAASVGRSTVGLFSTRTLAKEAAFKVGPSAAITALAWSPAAATLAVGGRSGLVQLWDVRGSPQMMRSLAGLSPEAGVPEAVQGLAFSPDGRLLAASDSSATISHPDLGEGLAHVGNNLGWLAIWQASTGRLFGTTRDLGTGRGRYGALAFSPDRRLLAVSQPDGSDAVLDLGTGELRRQLYPLGSDDTVSLVFGANGTLATGTEGGIVQLWNPITGKQVADPVAVAAGPVTSLAFDSAGQRFVTTGGTDGAVKLWAASTLQQQGSALTTEPRTAMTAVFEPGGAALFVIDARGNGFTWPTSLASWDQRACAIAGRNLTAEEWSRYLPGQPYARVCP